MCFIYNHFGRIKDENVMKIDVNPFFAFLLLAKIYPLPELHLQIKMCHL